MFVSMIIRFDLDKIKDCDLFDLGNEPRFSLYIGSNVSPPKGGNGSISRLRNGC